MLSVIIGYCSILREDMKTGEPLRQYVDLIFASAERAAQLTRNLLAFSRKQVLKISAADVNAITVAVEPLLARLTGEAVVMEVSLADEPLWVMGDSVQIEQVLMNLVSNARDAMPQGGRLTIATSRIVMDDEFRRVHGFGKAGPYALVSVADTGVGMDDSTRERVFEPFFTTKDVGKGTGLGLSSAFGIVKQHQGYIEVESRLGKGTTFSIYLPLLDSVETAAAAPRTAVSVSKGSETILLAEDNDEVRSMLARVLEGAGYSVIPARDGLHAVSEFKASADRISLLIMDVMMPNKNGKEAYEEIKAIRPDVKVLFVTGYAADILRQSGLNDREAAFLSKPVMPTALLAKIRELLDHGEALGAG
jgi:CheY-like chemotaxis protein